MHVDVTLEQLYLGHTFQVNIARMLSNCRRFVTWIWCKTCLGTGADPKAGMHACHSCGGSGVKTFIQQIGGMKQYVRSVYADQP